MTVFLNNLFICSAQENVNCCWCLLELSGSGCLWRVLAWCCDNCYKQDCKIPAPTGILLHQGHTLARKGSTAQLEDLQDATRVWVGTKDQETFMETEHRGAWSYEALLLAVWQHQMLRGDQRSR